MKKWLSEAEALQVDGELLGLVRLQIKEMEAWPTKALPVLEGSHPAEA